MLTFLSNPFLQPLPQIANVHHRPLVIRTNPVKSFRKVGYEISALYRLLHLPTYFGITGDVEAVVHAFETPVTIPRHHSMTL